MSDIKHRRCPECGDADRLRASAEAKWDRVAGAWIIAEWTEQGVECTTCDWAGPVEDTEFHEGPFKIDDHDDPCADVLRQNAREIIAAERRR